MAKEDSEQMEKVMDVFNDFFAKKFKTQKSIVSTTSSNYEESKTDSFKSTNDIDSKKQELKDQMGPSVFNFYYDYLYKARTDPSTDEALMRKQLTEMVGTNKDLKNLIFSLEQIIFREVQQGI